MHAWLPFPHRPPERVERIALPWSSDAARNSNFTRAVYTVDNDACWGEPDVAALASHNDNAEMRKARLLGGQDAAAIAELLVGLLFAGEGHELPANRTMLVRLLRGS